MMLFALPIILALQLQFTPEIQFDGFWVNKDGVFEEVSIPCPEGREGCLVYHFERRKKR